MYQLTGSSHERARELVIPVEDVQPVIKQTGASEDVTRYTLKESGSDLTDANLNVWKSPTP